METKKIAIAVLIILAFGAGGYYFYTKNNNSAGYPFRTEVVLSPAPSPTLAIDKNLDSDKDSIPDRVEKAIGTDPNKADTDGDGYSDLAEIKNGYSPLVPGSTKLSLEEWQTLKDKIKAADKEFYEKIFKITPAPFQSLSPAASRSPLSFACGTDTVKDVDNNIYNTVKIGEQCWLKENLKVTKNPAGQAITRYCYDNDPKICATDGGLYDWNTAMNKSTTESAQGICPNGWHVPKDSEWYVLESGLSTGECLNNREDWGCSGAETKLRLNGSSGFNGILVGYRGPGGGFSHIRSAKTFGRTFFWSSSESEVNAWIRDLGAGDSTIYRYIYDKDFGFSIRCLKD